MKCCGSDRTTPFCPSCGKELMKPNPLVKILASYRRKYRAAKNQLIKCERYYVNVPSHVELVKAQKEENTLRGMVEALEESMSNLGNPAKVMSDWLKENGYEEAGKALLGAFTGVPS